MEAAGLSCDAGGWQPFCPVAEAQHRDRELRRRAAVKLARCCFQPLPRRRCFSRGNKIEQHAACHQRTAVGCGGQDERRMAGGSEAMLVQRRVRFAIVCDTPEGSEEMTVELQILMG